MAASQPDPPRYLGGYKAKSMDRFEPPHWMGIGGLNHAIGAPVSDPARFRTLVINAPDRKSALRSMELRAVILDTAERCPPIQIESGTAMDNGNGL